MDGLISRQAAIDAVFSLCEDCDSGYCGSCRVNYPGEKDVIKVIRNLPPAESEPAIPLQPEVKEIGYVECANAMLKMWIDNVLTDGEYNRIMDRLNAYP